MSPLLNIDPRAKRIVVKVGSALLVDQASGQANHAWLAGFAADAARIRERGQHLISEQCHAPQHLARHIVGHIALIAEIYSRLDARLKIENGAAPALRLITQSPAHQRQSLIALGGCIGLDQVRKPFGFSQIKFTIQKGAPGELAGLRGP